MIAELALILTVSGMCYIAYDLGKTRAHLDQLKRAQRALTIIRAGDAAFWRRCEVYDIFMDGKISPLVASEAAAERARRYVSHD